VEPDNWERGRGRLEGISSSSSIACEKHERGGAHLGRRDRSLRRRLHLGADARLRIPKLFMAGEVDDAAVDLLRVFDETAPEPTDVVTLDTGEHGRDILAYADVAVADALREAVLDFLART